MLMRKLLLFCFLTSAGFTSLHGQLLPPEWAVAGKIRPRPATEITGSAWSVGAETMDRNYTIYNNWKEYLAPLGFKKARLQGGWARTERQKDVYDWAWLDSIVFDISQRGVKPWIGLGYGNSVYENGGGTTLFGALPATEEALTGWDNWVRAMVTRYGKVVNEWEIWNEPNYHIPAADYARFLIRTAALVKSIQPEAHILAFALGSGVDYAYADKVLGEVAAAGKLSLIDQVTFHRHQFVPEDYAAVEKLAEVVRRHDPRITIRQGESGAPTSRCNTKALNNYDWTELTAAKWALRRLLGDLGRDIPSNYFSIMDMKYPDEMNTKGLLISREDQTVERPKQAYFALQHLASVFDDQWERVPHPFVKVSADTAYSMFTYRHRKTGGYMVTLWLNNGIPKDNNSKLAADVICETLSFRDPVYVDLRTGLIYRIPRKQ
jgi:hypothetical protein